MLELRLAKSKMENEEGMNHLWIRLETGSLRPTQPSEMVIRLPEGLYRSYNLNGLKESGQEHIMLDAYTEDVMIELYTREAIPCGEATITVSVRTAGDTIEREIGLRIVEADEMDEAEIDEQVVERIKELSTFDPPPDTETDTGFRQPKTIEIKANEWSSLEREYRIDY